MTNDHGGANLGDGAHARFFRNARPLSKLVRHSREGQEANHPRHVMPGHPPDRDDATKKERNQHHDDDNDFH